jgi:hypothetical protein
MFPMSFSHISRCADSLDHSTRDSHIRAFLENFLCVAALQVANRFDFPVSASLPIRQARIEYRVGFCFDARKANAKAKAVSRRRRPPIHIRGRRAHPIQPEPKSVSILALSSIFPSDYPAIIVSAAGRRLDNELILTMKNINIIPAITVQSKTPDLALVAVSSGGSGRRHRLAGLNIISIRRDRVGALASWRVLGQVGERCVCMYTSTAYANCAYKLTTREHKMGAV